MRHRLSALSAACGLLLAVQVATARADDPQPPVTPAVPTVAVQVSVTVPNVSVNVQGGIVDISVPGVDVDVSVSVSSKGSLSGTKADASAAQQPTTQSDGAGNCCNAGTEQVAPAGRSMKKTRVLRAAPARRRARPTVRAAANGARARGIRVPPADRSTRLQAANHPPPTSARPATRPKARRGCCDGAQAPIAIAPTRLEPRPGTGLRPDRYDDAVTRPAVLPEAHVRDNRLFLQLGVLGAFLYLACVAGWFSATRLRRA